MKELEKLIRRDSRDLKEESDREKAKLRQLAQNDPEELDWFVARFRLNRNLDEKV